MAARTTTERTSSERTARGHAARGHAAHVIVARTAPSASGSSRPLRTLFCAGGARTFGVFVGVGTQVFFLATVVYLFRFLHGTLSTGRSIRGPMGWSWDLFLTLQFAIPHSILLHPTTRRRLTKWIPSSFYGCFFCCVTCASLWWIFLTWQRSDTVLTLRDGGGKVLMDLLFGASWLALFYSLSLQGLGYQTGLTPWWYWWRRQLPPPRKFVERGVYRCLRHPIYLSFLGLLWFTPVWTLDRVLLVGVWSLYIYVGSVLKDRRLTFYLGAKYAEYAARVPGYPGMVFGPLGRVQNS